MTKTFDLHEIALRTDIPLRTLRHVADSQSIKALVWQEGTRRARLFDMFNAFVLSVAGSLIQSGMTLQAAAKFVNAADGCQKSERKESLHWHFVNRDDFMSGTHCKEKEPVKIHVDIGYLRNALAKVPQDP